MIKAINITINKKSKIYGYLEYKSLDSLLIEEKGIFCNLLLLLRRLFDDLFECKLLGINLFVDKASFLIE